jgi:hypothetical protein
METATTGTTSITTHTTDTIIIPSTTDTTTTITIIDASGDCKDHSTYFLCEVSKGGNGSVETTFCLDIHQSFVIA